MTATAKDDHFRRNVLNAARMFKENWFELGAKLTQVANERLYKNWGHQSFEEYCSTEIRIKKNTAIKLTNAWFFLRHEEPRFLSANTQEELPDLDSVCLLSKAKKNGLAPEMYEQLRDNAFIKKQSGSTLSKQFRSMQKSLEESEASNIRENFQFVKIKKALEQRNAPQHLLRALGEVETFLASTSPRGDTRE